MLSAGCGGEKNKDESHRQLSLHSGSTDSDSQHHRLSPSILRRKWRKINCSGDKTEREERNVAVRRATLNLSFAKESVKHL